MPYPELRQGLDWQIYHFKHEHKTHHSISYTIECTPRNAFMCITIFTTEPKGVNLHIFGQNYRLYSVEDAFKVMELHAQIEAIPKNLEM